MSCVTRTVSLVFAVCSVVRARLGAEKRPVACFLVGNLRLAPSSSSLARAGVLRTVTAKGRLQLAGAREDAVRAAPGRKGETVTA